MEIEPHPTVPKGQAIHFCRGIVSPSKRMILTYRRSEVGTLCTHDTGGLDFQNRDLMKATWVPANGSIQKNLVHWVSNLSPDPDDKSSPPKRATPPPWDTKISKISRSFPKPKRLESRVRNIPLSKRLPAPLVRVSHMYIYIYTYTYPHKMYTIRNITFISHCMHNRIESCEITLNPFKSY